MTSKQDNHPSLVTSLRIELRKTRMKLFVAQSGREKAEVRAKRAEERVLNLSRRMDKILAEVNHA